MNNQHLQLVGATGPRVDGIDVAQLLHDLGEASAVSKPVDLFGLLLAAQHVLVAVQAKACHLAAHRVIADGSRQRREFIS